LTSNNSKLDPVIQKIKFTKEELEEIQKIKKGEPIKRTRIAKNHKRAYEYEYTTNRPLTKEMVKTPLTQFYGGICTGCGVVWPDYKVSYDKGDEQQPIKLVERYCDNCFNYRN